ncbi:hypothetical protein [Neoroseomonas oryzicola]|uniref:Tat pathway signal sequence domain protein n=1 Tax=Neoroseomonas oryzicola TaxID=535904 RepID=A0A9X9WIW7_9PROT|nr:hypothetical protein [Neoroseomonas oryzicola]MBR0660277.1 hypothetical protein [Neoroseomonas oryzicola]NKE18036.1 hypothetical protein [Neoroseomonas oryzicola]
MFMRRFLTAATAAVLAWGGLGAAAQAQTGDPSFNLVNRSNRTIYEAYASPSSDSNWGQDRLGQNVIPAGRSFVVRLPQGECIYDVRVVYERAGGPAEERRNINLCNLTELAFDGSRAQAQQQGGQRPQQQQQQQRPQQAGPTGNPSFNLVNQGRATVMEVYASLTTDQNWGPDRLGADTVAPGAVYPVRLPEGPCMYDIRFVYDNGQPQERRNVNLCEVTNITVPLQ